MYQALDVRVRSMKSQKDADSFIQRKLTEGFKEWIRKQEIVTHYSKSGTIGNLCYTFVMIPSVWWSVGFATIFIQS